MVHLVSLQLVCVAVAQLLGSAEWKSKRSQLEGMLSVSLRPSSWFCSSVFYTSALVSSSCVPVVILVEAVAWEAD